MNGTWLSACQTVVLLEGVLTFYLHVVVYDVE